MVSRLSGDEFVLLFYGYSSQDQIREKIRTLSSAMKKSVAILPSGNELRISTVSYTHLDVYKRQMHSRCRGRGAGCLREAPAL